MAFLTMKPGTLLSPVPAALISSGAEGIEGRVRNLMTAAWVGTVCSDPPMVSVSVRPSRYTWELIRRSGEFVVNVTDRKMLRGTDYCGVRSGREEDKFARCGFTPVKAEGLQYAPAVAESPVYLGCLVRQEMDLGSHTLFLGEVISMGIREDLMKADGAIDLQKAGLIAYSHGTYSAVGEPLGFYGFSVASPDVLKRRMNDLRKRECRKK